MDGDIPKQLYCPAWSPCEVALLSRRGFPAGEYMHAISGTVTASHAGLLRWMAAFPDSRQKALKGMKDWNWEPLVNLIDLQEVRTGVSGSH